MLGAWCLVLVTGCWVLGACYPSAILHAECCMQDVKCGRWMLDARHWWLMFNCVRAGQATAAKNTRPWAWGMNPKPVRPAPQPSVANLVRKGEYANVKVRCLMSDVRCQKSCLSCVSTVCGTVLIQQNWRQRTPWPRRAKGLVG